MPDETTSTRTLLLTFAHPDDESVGAAGTMARYARDGATRVVLVMATRGQAASHGVELAGGSREALGHLRERELRAAAAILGVHELHVLDYQDKHLAEADVDRIRRELVTIIRASRPAVVLTFDPNGTNRHPDHIAISRFTNDAVAVAADPRWLPDTGTAHTVARVVWTPPRSVWTMIRETGDADVRTALATRPGADYVIDLRDYWTLKRDAMLAHVSQRPVVDKHVLGHGDTERVLSAEVFRHAWGAPPPARPTGCLFDGLDA